MLDVTVRNHISAVEQRRGISFQIISEIVSLGDKNLNKQVSIIVNEYINQIAALISEGIKSGEIKRDIDPISAAILIYGIIQGLVNVWSLNNYSFNLIERYSSVWDIFQNTVANHQN